MNYAFYELTCLFSIIFFGGYRCFYIRATRELSDKFIVKLIVSKGEKFAGIVKKIMHIVEYICPIANIVSCLCLGILKTLLILDYSP